jgi:cytoskeleton-associated protein 5
MAAFADLRQLAGALRLAPGDYGEVTRLIKKTLTKDANVAVISAAVESAAALSKALRRDYRSDARQLTGAVLDKFKDKNGAVIRALHSALNTFGAFSYTLSGALRAVLLSLRVTCSVLRLNIILTRAASAHRRV